MSEVNETQSQASYQERRAKSIAQQLFAQAAVQERCAQSLLAQADAKKLRAKELRAQASAQEQLAQAFAWAVLEASSQDNVN